MSLGYSVVAKLNANYQESHIRDILRRGAELGIGYHDFSLGLMSYSSPELEINEATRLVLKGAPDDLHCLTISVQETYATLHFLNDEGYLLIMFSGLSHLWSKKYFDGDEGIDIARYVKTLLDLVDNFRVLELRVEKD